MFKKGWVKKAFCSVMDYITAPSLETQKSDQEEKEYNDRVFKCPSNKKSSTDEESYLSKLDQ